MAAAIVPATPCARYGTEPLSVPFTDRVPRCFYCEWGDAGWTAPCGCGMGHHLPICLGCCKKRGLENVYVISRPYPALKSL